MGTSSLFEEKVRTIINTEKKSQTIEVLDNHGIPEIRIANIDGLLEKDIFISFDDWQKYENFIDALNQIHERLKNIKK